MVTAVSVKQGWFYECLTDLPTGGSRSPSISACLCSDPSHGISSPTLKGRNEAFLSHATHYLRVTFRVARPQMYSETETKILELLVHLHVLRLQNRRGCLSGIWHLLG